MIRTFSITLAVGAWCVACEGGGNQTSTAADGHSSTGGAGGASTSSGAAGAASGGNASTTDPPACNPDDFSGPLSILACKTDCDPKLATDSEKSVCIQRVEGRLIDQEGAPIPLLGVSICGEVCYGGASDEEGRFSIPVFAWYEPEEYSIGPHGSPHLSSFYHQLSAEFPGGKPYPGGDIRMLELPGDGPLFIDRLDLDDDEDAPAQAVTSGPVTIAVGEGTAVALTIGDALEGDEGHRFRALELEKELHIEYAPQFGLEARLFVLGPFDASFEVADDEERPSVTLTVDNTEDWAAGTEIEVYALGTYYDEEWIPPHTFAPIGTATVTADGASVELPHDAPGAGLHHLTWIALSPTFDL